MKEKFKKLILFIFNPRLLFCFAVAWFITNGWSYFLFFIGTYYQIPTLIAISSAYIAFLWLPISPEKILTFTIAIFLLRWLFPNDKNSLGVLRDLLKKAKNVIKSKKKSNSNSDKQDSDKPDN